MVRAIKILSWKNDFMRRGTTVMEDPTDEDIVNGVNSTLGYGKNNDDYKYTFLSELNEKEGKNYNIKMDDTEFVQVLVKEKMIEIVKAYIPQVEKIERSVSSESNVRPELREYWTPRSEAIKKLNGNVEENKPKRANQKSLSEF